MTASVELRLKVAAGASDEAIRALVPTHCYGQSGGEWGPEPRGHWLHFRIIGTDRFELAESLAQAALASDLVADAEIMTIGTGSRTVITTRTVERT